MPPSNANHHWVQGVVFDLDGLLVNTELVFRRAGRELARRRGKTMSDTLFQQMMGRRPAEAFTIMVQGLELSDPIEQLQRESEEIFFDLVEIHLQTMPGLARLLDELDRLELPRGVATSSPREYTEDILSRVQIADRFHFALTAEDVRDGKPHPEIYQKAAQRLGIAPESMLVLEDSEAGIRAAAGANAIAVAVPHEFSRTHDFSQATYIADRLDAPQILQLLTRSS